MKLKKTLILPILLTAIIATFSVAAAITYIDFTAFTDNLTGQEPPEEQGFIEFDIIIDPSVAFIEAWASLNGSAVVGEEIQWAVTVRNVHPTAAMSGGLLIKLDGATEPDEFLYDTYNCFVGLLPGEKQRFEGTWTAIEDTWVMKVDCLTLTWT